VLPVNKIEPVTSVVQKVTNIWDKAKTANTIDLFSFPLDDLCVRTHVNVVEGSFQKNSITDAMPVQNTNKMKSQQQQTQCAIVAQASGAVRNVCTYFFLEGLSS